MYRRRQLFGPPNSPLRPFTVHVHDHRLNLIPRRRRSLSAVVTIVVASPSREYTPQRPPRSVQHPKSTFRYAHPILSSTLGHFTLLDLSVVVDVDAGSSDVPMHHKYGLRERVTKYSTDSISVVKEAGLHDSLSTLSNSRKYGLACPARGRCRR